MTYLQKKKRAFMNVVNSVKGFVRNVSGAFPLVAYDCVNTKGVIDYTITGDGVGEYDEESGKYKIPVICKGINLFNPEEVISKFRNGDYETVSSYHTTYIQLKPNTTYYAKTFAAKGSGHFYISKNKQTSLSIDHTITIVNQASLMWPRKTENIITTGEEGLMYIGYYLVGGDNNRDKILRENKIQIVEGSYTALTAPDYEPYQEPVITDIFLDKPLQEGQTKNYKKDRLPALPAMQGTTIYTVDTSMVPEKMEVSYYSTSKE